MDIELSVELAAKIDEFAASLSVEDQSVLADLLSDGDDHVGGFGAGIGWPGVVNLVPFGAEMLTPKNTVGDDAQLASLRADVERRT